MLEWITSSCFLILSVLALRAVLGRKISARFRYALWVLILVRLLVPVQLFTSPVAGMSIPVSPSISEKWEERSLYVLPVGSVPVEDASDIRINEDGTIGDASSFGYPKLSGDGEKIVRYADRISPLQVLKIIWFLGGMVVAVILLASNLRFAARLCRVRRPAEGTACRIPVYVAESLPSPCLFGFLRPALYITQPVMDSPVMLRHVLAHELTHYRHLDHVWSVLRAIALAVHWWNPLVWLAVIYSRRDGELACDEGALKTLDSKERRAYGETLLALVTAKPSPRDLLCCATTMSGERRSLRERIWRISREPKQLISAFIAAAIIASATAVCAFGQAVEMDPASASEWWKSAEITVDEAGIPCIRYITDEGEQYRYGEPVPAPAEWAGQDLAGRDKAAALTNPPDGHLWAEMVSPDEGWLVTCWGHGTGIADTYVYKTSDGGKTWTECAMPGLGWHVSTVGFLGPDRLIVAQSLFQGAPIMMTKDGGETWEEIETLIDWDTVDAKIEGSYAVSHIYTYGSMVQMTFIGDFAMVWTMISEDLGDTWTVAESAPLDQFLAALSESDIGDISSQDKVTAAELVMLLRETASNRMSRFYDYSSYAEQENWILSEASWKIPLADGSTLHLDASSKNTGNLFIVWETMDSAPTAIYHSEDLHALVCDVGESYTCETLLYPADLDHNGEPEKIRIAEGPDGMSWALDVIGDDWSWFQTAYSAHVGWNALFLCQIDGEDYLLQYNPYMSGGVCQYRYELFYLQDGMKVAVQENQVDFDIVFSPDYTEQHVFDPKAIASFMDEINALLADSMQILNTDENLLGSFEKEGRLYDSLWWLEEYRKPELSLLENLLVYRNEAVKESAVPDVRELLRNLERDDVKSMGGVGIIPSADLVSALNSVSGITEVYLEDRNSTGNKYEVRFTSAVPYNHTVILQLEAGEGTGDVYLDFEGTIPVPFYSENPDNDAMYLTDVPYSVTAIANDMALYQMVIEHT